MQRLFKIILYDNYAESLDYVCGHAFLHSHNGALNFEKPSVNYKDISTAVANNSSSCLGIDNCKKRKSLKVNHMKTVQAIYLIKI